MRFSPFRLIPLLALFASCHTASSYTSELLEKSALERTAKINAVIAEADIPNIILGYVTRDGATEFLAHGSLSSEDPTPVDEDTLYMIASMTKAVTATAALQLVEAGDVALDDPLEEVFPELREVKILEDDGTNRTPNGAITLRHLLSHTSGFAYFFTSPAIAKSLQFDPSNGFPLAEEISEGQYDWGFGVQPRRIFDAGEDWVYGRGVGVAGRVIERLSGEDLDTYTKANIFAPLGMSRTGYNVSPELMTQLAPLHLRSPLTGELSILPSMRPARLERFYGGGDLLSTPRDYATFLRCMLNGGTLEGEQILSPESVELFFSNQLPAGVMVQMDPMEGVEAGGRRTFQGDYDDKFSLAWALEVGSEDGLRSEGAGYWSGIYNTYYTIDKERGFAVFAFSQLMPFDDPEVYELFRTYEDLVYRNTED